MDLQHQFCWPIGHHSDSVVRTLVPVPVVVPVCSWPVHQFGSLAPFDSQQMLVADKKEMHRWCSA